ncbi:DMT family transporter [Micromonospora yangpuensis]|uniref:Magnesium transporter NIPA n=1 Tax=Micromonospora yangpuensis TaxID=683228 RepID=A0A1C6UUU2_9ACTN|nr:DMT family transporter [Micromonospora yangpuensis]GGM23811.1 hypothetical protein GCM10012279_47660 [Micromonospora yangpuensis]SCL57807.1 hypothetical protein GA0070617_3634 [Micromonospora yangpuensis]
MLLAVLLSFATAFCYGLSAAVHQRAAKRERPHAALDPRLLVRLFRNRLWLSGWLPDTAGAALHATALRFGPLVLVQPVLASGLFMAILIEAVLDRRRVLRRDAMAIGVGATGLAAFLVVSDARAGVTDPSLSSWVWVGVGAGVAVAGCVLLSVRLRGAVRGAVLGVACGIAYSVAAALAKAVVGRYQGDLVPVLLDWRFAALALVALLGLLLNQNAFQSGRLAAPLTALTLTDPVVSVVVGVTAFQETVSLGGIRLVGLGVSAVAILAGIWLAGTGSRQDRR